MARRTNVSCVGMAFMGYLLLHLWVIVGYALSLPFTLPDLMAAQKPPLEPHGFSQHAVLYGIPVVAAAAVTAVAGRGRPCPRWMFLTRTGLLLVLAWAATAWAGSRVDSLDGSAQAALGDGSARAVAQSGAATVVAVVCYCVVRRIGRGARPVHRPRIIHRPRIEHGPRIDHGAPKRERRRPAPGEIWHAEVPFRDNDGSKTRYCVIVGNRAGHAEVLKITSKDKDHRSDHIRMPNDGWDFSSGLDHWVEIGLPPLKVPYADFTEVRPKGHCPAAVWRRLQEAQRAPRSRAT